jgi:hypothetical protein
MHTAPSKAETITPTESLLGLQIDSAISPIHLSPDSVIEIETLKDVVVENYYDVK